jgi:hypothetical protein
MPIAAPRCSPENSPSLYVGAPRSPAELEAARRLHTRVYVETGYVDPATELLDDGYMAQRRWIVASAGPAPVGTISLIYPGTSLPTLTAFGIDPVRHPKLAGPWSRGRVVELSTLAVDPAWAHASVSAVLFRAVWQERHRRQDHDIWLMSSQPRLFDRLCQLFPAPWEMLGRARDYYRHQSVAYVLDFHICRSALEHRSLRTLAWLDGRVAGVHVPESGMAASKGLSEGAAP